MLGAEEKRKLQGLFKSTKTIEDIKAVARKLLAGRTEGLYSVCLIDRHLLRILKKDGIEMELKLGDSIYYKPEADEIWCGHWIKH